MSAPSPPPPRPGLGPPPSLDGLTQLLSEANIKGVGGSNNTPQASTSSNPPPRPLPPPTNGSPKKSNGNAEAAAVSKASASSASLSPNHPFNLRKQAKTQLDASFSVKSYIGAANALLEKARSSDAQGQAEQAFVNYLKAADVAANIPKHAEWPKTVEQRGATYYRYQDFMKNVPDIIQRGHRLEELLKAREEARAEEARKALVEQRKEQIYMEQDLDDNAVGGTDAITEQSAAQMDSLASRLSALRGSGSGDAARKRMTVSGSSATGMAFSASHDGATSASASTSPQSRPAGTMGGTLPSPRLEKSGFFGISDGQPVGPDLQPTYIPTNSEFNKTYPTLDDFESQHPQPHTPARPLPMPPSAASGATRRGPPPPKREITVEELFPMLHPGFDTLSDPALGTRMVRRKAPRVLIFDVRPRAEWMRSRIKDVDSVNIDAASVQGSTSLASVIETQTSMTTAERRTLDERDSYDVWLLCDQDGRGMSNGRLDPLYQALTDEPDRQSTDRCPRFLAGGFERWSRKVGEAGLQGSPIPSDAAANNGRVGGIGNKRQGMYLGSPPAALIPGHAAGNGIGSARSSLSGYGSGLEVADSPSMPARTYQTSNAASAMPSGMGQPTSTHARQPHIPLYASPSNANTTTANASPLRQQSTGSFDYPQLQQSQMRPLFNGMQTPAPPPAIAAASGGLGMRSPSLESAGRTTSMDLTRRPPIPSPYGGPVLSSSAAAAARQQHTSTALTRPPMDEAVRIGMTGLKNVGNSCYMNSTIQCLSATIPLARFLLDGSYKKAINRVNPLGTQGALAEAFAQLIRVLWSEQYTFVSPVTFREAIMRFAPAFQGYDQHDAQEFLAYLLDGLHEDLNYVKQKPPPVDMTPAREQELETLPQQVASVKEWAIYRERNDSLIVDWFQGQFRNKLTCLTCGKTSTTYNAFLYLSLPIPATPRGGKVTLAQCLDAFTRDEILDKADAWHCPRCNKPRKATKKLTISRLPQVLLIHLKRFSFKGPFTDKVETNVSFPTSNLDLTNYMPPPLPPGAVPRGTPISASQQPPYLYDLYAATHHFGSLTGGHYTATIRTQGEHGQPQWMYCDDSKVTRLDERQIHTPSTYILWWHRKGR